MLAGVPGPDLRAVCLRACVLVGRERSLFYARASGELALAGTVSPSGVVALTESAGGKAGGADAKKSGAFVGQVQAGGAMTGTWSDAAGSHPRAFTLAPIARLAGAPAIVAERAERTQRKARGEGVVFVEDFDCAGCAYPSSGGRAFNLVLATGEDVPFDRLLAPGAKAKLPALLAGPVRARVAATSGSDPGDSEQLTEAFLAGDYVLDPQGVRFIGFFQLPHVVQALDADLGVVLPYTRLRGLLAPSSPLRAAWTP